MQFVNETDRLANVELSPEDLREVGDCTLTAVAGSRDGKDAVLWSAEACGRRTLACTSAREALDLLRHLLGRPARMRFAISVERRSTFRWTPPDGLDGK